MKAFLALLKGIWVWGLLSWGYVAAIVLNPFTSQSQLWPLSYYVPIPTNLVGIIGFVISFFAFIIYEWKR